MQRERLGTASAVPFLLALTAIVLVALLRVAATYHVFGQVFDEPAHVACGVDFVSTGRYVLEPQHPPLARLAIGLTARAANPAGGGTPWERGNAILYAGDYRHNLARARSGVLLFLFCTIVVTWSWARRLYGDRIALLAALFVSTTPVLLAHSGLATTDAAVAAMTLLALDRFSRWRSAMTPGNALLLGAAVALAVTAKFSALLFLPAGFAAILLSSPRAIPWREPAFARRLLISAMLAMLTFGITVWAVYLFSPDAPARLSEGLRIALAHEQNGHPGYLLGHVSSNGFWYFFLVAFAVKTPLAMIVLLIAAAARGKLDEPAAIAAAFFLVTMPVHINIGLRHLLPVVPFVAMLAAAGAGHLARRRAGLVIATLLVAWHLGSTSWAHPNYLSYFNEIAAHSPDYFLVDSDLDWGQDILALGSAAGADTQPLTIGYFGTADLHRHMHVPFYYLHPGEQPFGWIALSETIFRKGTPPGRFAFLDDVPYTMVGTSIRLYFRRRP
jgi:hypothetical protein